MRAVVQRVGSASVSVAGEIVGRIGSGLLVFVGVAGTDGPEDVHYIGSKISDLRIFADENGKMNLSALDTGCEVIVVSQFTLYGDIRKGRRPSFIDAAAPDLASPRRILAWASMDDSSCSSCAVVVWAMAEAPEAGGVPT